MNVLVTQAENASIIPIECITPQSNPEESLSSFARTWINATAFTPEPGSKALIPGQQGDLDRVLIVIDPQEPMWALGNLSLELPEGIYQIAATNTETDASLLALGFALGAYQFTQYHKAKRQPARLLVTEKQHSELQPAIDAITRVRHLINTPTNDMGPEQLATVVKDLGKRHQAGINEWVGEQLLQHNFPTIHAVGRASHRPPRLVELDWGNPSHPELVLVGKGVCFDTGGLDLKPPSGMRWMKKDMGGAAHAIALAQWIMQAQLPVHLRLLIPTVENSVAGNAMRPGDVVKTRAGHTVEIHNTDAEGRLILCDALAYGAESRPDLMMDFATLTGAARVALGPDLPAVFTNHDALTTTLMTTAQAVHDPVWQLPLWQPYNKLLDSYLADFANAGNSRHAGAITAALYLKHFVPDETQWLHTDVYAWNDTDRPGRPRGGEAQSLRAAFTFLQHRYNQ